MRIPAAVAQVPRFNSPSNSTVLPSIAVDQLGPKSSGKMSAPNSQIANAPSGCPARNQSLMK
jgi:hypothetical protein